MEQNFYQKVYEFVKQIPKGRVASYGIVAAFCGSPKASRSVGAALHRNPDPKHIPCHRVVFADGKLAPGFAFGGPDAQRKLLEKEGVKFLADGNVIMDQFVWIRYNIKKNFNSTSTNFKHSKLAPTQKLAP